MSLANYVTFIRIFLSPIFLVVYLLGTGPVIPYILLGLLAITEFSDAMDGYLARKYNEVTDLGKILDPMADSIARISVFLTFTQPPVNIPILLIFIFIYRDSVISTLRTICALKGFTLAARTSGKIKALFQGIAGILIVLLMIPYSLGRISNETLTYFSTWIVSLVAVYTFFSGIDYIYANRYYIVRLLVQPKKKKSRKHVLIEE